MASGPYTRAKYERDDLKIVPIRVQPETITAVGGEPTGAINERGRAKVGGSRRTYGLHARGMRLARDFGTGDNKGTRYNFLPILSTTAFATFTEGETVTYGGFDWQIIELVSEKWR